MVENLNSKNSDNDNEVSISFKEIFSTLARRKKLFIVTTLLFFSGTFVYTIYERLKNPTFSGNFELLIADPIGSEKIEGDRLSGFRSLAINKSDNDVRLLKLFLKSPFAIKSLADELNISHSSLEKTIKIEPRGGRSRDNGSILKVIINVKDKKLGEKIVKRLSQVYLDLAVEIRQKKLSDGLKFLDKQTPSVMKKYQEIAKEFAAFRKRYGTLDPKVEGEILKKKIADRNDQVLNTIVIIENLEGIKEDIKNKTISTKGFKELLNSSNDFLSLNISTFNQTILSEAEALEERIRSAKSKYKSNSEMVFNLEEKLYEMRPSIIEAQIDSINTSLQIQKDLLVSYKLGLQNLENDFAKHTAILTEFNELQQRVNLNEENLLSIAKARENFRLEIAQNTPPWTIISPPKISSNPISPNIPLYLTYGAFFSLILGSITTFLRDKLDNKYHYADQIIKDLDTICLATIPHVSFFDGVREDKRLLLDDIDNIEDSSEKLKEKNKDEKDLLTQEKNYQRFFYQEAFRNAITSLRFLQSDKEIKTITITSSMPAEGKSLINILLSKTYSELDKKVLLIDADLRKPQLHVRLGLNNILGLSNLLIDSTLDVNNVIQKIDGFNNWSVITAGISPPDPARLLSSEKITKLISNLKNSDEYDIIIFDTPPVIGLADASLVAEKTDGSILLVTTEKVPVGLPKDAKKIMEKSGTEFLGVIVNCIKKNEKKLIGSGYNPDEIYSNYANPPKEEIKEEYQNSIKNKIKFYLDKISKWIED